MSTTTTLQEEVHEQVAIGFELPDIYENLQAKGYSKADISEALGQNKFADEVAAAESEIPNPITLIIIIASIGLLLWGLYDLSVGNSSPRRSGCTIGSLISLLYFGYKYYFKEETGEKEGATTTGA